MKHSDLDLLAARGARLQVGSHVALERATRPLGHVAPGDSGGGLLSFSEADCFEADHVDMSRRVLLRACVTGRVAP